jgi:competence protein ComEC
MQPSEAEPDLLAGGASGASLRRAPGRAAGRWLASQFLAERERWPLWLPVLLGTGIGVYFSLSVEPPPLFGAALLGLALALLAVAWRGAARLPAIALLALALGFAAAQFQTWRVAAPVLGRRLGPVTVEGGLLAIDPLPEGTRLLIAPSRVDRLADPQLPARIRVRLRGEAGGLLPGDRVALRAILLPPPAPALPGAYDFQRRAWFDRIGAVGFALGQAAALPPLPGESRSMLAAAIETLRAGVTARIRSALPDRDGAIAAAIIAGETHAIPPADAGAFRDAGLAHILVIAGLHMGMVAGICFFALRAFFALIPALALRFPTKKWSALGALAAVFGYMLLSGATVSSRRAFVMTGLALFAVLVDRLSLSARAVAIAAAAILLMTPESAAGPSFQMSFAAVACLVAFWEAMRVPLSAWHRDAGFVGRAGLYLVAIAFTTLVTTVATAPFTVYHFNRFPLYSIIANALAVPITGFWVMPWAIVSLLLMPLGLEAWALAPMAQGIAAIVAIAHWVTSWPGAVMTLPSPSAASLAAAGFGGVWLCLWIRPWRFLGLAPLALGLLGIFLGRPPDLVISADAREIALRAGDGSYLPSVSKAFAEAWTRRAAAPLGPAWPQNGSLAEGALSCDAMGCVYRARGRLVALIRDGAALAEDCATADLVVSPVAAHRACRGAQIIDRIDTLRQGGHAVWLSPESIRIETVRQWQGDRPWSPWHAKE